MNQLEREQEFRVLGWFRFRYSRYFLPRLPQLRQAWKRAKIFRAAAWRQASLANRPSAGRASIGSLALPRPVAAPRVGNAAGSGSIFPVIQVHQESRGLRDNVLSG